MLRRRLLQAALALALAACASAPPPAPDAVRQALAPTGTLRIAVYAGSPTSLVEVGGEPRGLSVELGAEIARRLGVPSTLLRYPRVAEVVAALQRGEADLTITNTTAERQKILDFAPPLVALELGVLVPAGSPLRSVDAIDSAGLRIGVSQGSSSQVALGATLKRAQLLPQPTLQAARAALASGGLDGFATNKAILFELGDQLPGAQVLPGRWGLEHLALGTGPGRAAALPWLRETSAALQQAGLVQRAAERAGLRGSVAPDAR